MNHQSQYAVNCTNCRCQWDRRSFQVCPSCGMPGSLAQQQYALNQQQQAMSQGQYNLAQHLSAQMQKQNVKPNDYVPELAEYEKRVAAIVPYQAKETKGMFGLFIKRKELQLEIKKLADELDYHERQEEMRVAEAVQKERLKANEQVSAAKLDADAKVKAAEAKSELAITQLQGKFTREKSEILAAAAKDLAEAKAKAAEEYYEKLSKAMTELHQNGDKNSKFIQELALSMIQKTPKMLPTQAEVHLTGDVKDVLNAERS